MNISSDVPFEEDMQAFLQIYGAEWKQVTVIPWSTSLEGQTFLAVKTSDAGGLGQPFNCAEQGSAAALLNLMRKSHMPVHIRVNELDREFLFFHRKSSG